MSKEYTREEIQDQFLSHLKMLVKYWDNVPNKTSVEKMEGLLHSTLATIEGCSPEVVGFTLKTSPHPDDKRYHQESGEDWYPEDCDISGSLHSIFISKYSNRNKK